MGGSESCFVVPCTLNFKGLMRWCLGDRQEVLGGGVGGGGLLLNKLITE